MFKKITSNRDPRDTVFSELGKEFRPYLNKVKSGLSYCAERYPKFLFGMMVINITLSAVLVMTVFRPVTDKPMAKAPAVTSPVTSGFDRIMQAGEALKQTIHLKQRVDSLTKKAAMNHADSAELLKDLDSLQSISKPFNTSPHEY